MGTQHCVRSVSLIGKTIPGITKLGPLLRQFGYFDGTVVRGGKKFLARLAPFLSKLPKDHHFALEIRNKMVA
jgi:hypothetical protein